MGLYQNRIRAKPGQGRGRGGNYGALLILTASFPAAGPLAQPGWATSWSTYKRLTFSSCLKTITLQGNPSATHNIAKCPSDPAGDSEPAPNGLPSVRRSRRQTTWARAGQCQVEVRRISWACTENSAPKRNSHINLLRTRDCSSLWGPGCSLKCYSPDTGWALVLL